MPTLKKKITFKDIISVVTGFSTILVIFFGVSLATTVDNVKSIFALPKEVNALFVSDSLFHEFLQHSDHHHEMVWEMFRVMTDDDDTLQWYYVTEEGAAFDVDIRATAEDVEFAFVYRTNEIFPVFQSTADQRKYIVRHNGDNKDYMTFLRRR